MLSFASSESERFTGEDLYWEEPKISATAELLRFRLSNRSARTGPGVESLPDPSRALLHRERSGKLDRARSRLYRSQNLQENVRWKALAEIYTMHSFAQLCNLNSLSKFCQTSAKFCKN